MLSIFNAHQSAPDVPSMLVDWKSITHLQKTYTAPYDNHSTVSPFRLKATAKIKRLRSVCTNNGSNQTLMNYTQRKVRKGECSRNITAQMSRMHFPSPNRWVDVHGSSYRLQNSGAENLSRHMQ